MSDPDLNADAGAERLYSEVNRGSAGANYCQLTRRETDDCRHVHVSARHGRAHLTLANDMDLELVVEFSPSQARAIAEALARAADHAERDNPADIILWNAEDDHTYTVCDEFGDFVRGGFETVEEAVTWAEGVDGLDDGWDVMNADTDEIEVIR